VNEEIVDTHIDTNASKNLSQSGSNEQSTSINRGLVLLLAVSCAFTVANLYYIQPLLASIGHEFAVSAGEIGFVATTGQIGYA
jgi:hypothetical protein